MTSSSSKIKQTSSNYHSVILSKFTSSHHQGLDKLEGEANGISQLPRQMKSLFADGDYFDVKFKVEGQELPAYKGILVARCSYFAKMFVSNFLISFLSI